MSTATFIGILLMILVLSWVVWFLINHARRISEYDNEVKQRLRNICR